MVAVRIINPYTIFVFLISHLLLGTLVVEGSLGINWGRLATQRMIPSMVVDMMLQNNITEVKTFSSSNNVLEAFAGSGIKIAITLPNSAIKFLSNKEMALWWIVKNIKRYVDMNITFRHVYVGTQPLSNMLIQGTSGAVQKLDYMQEALEIANITGVKATFSIFSDTLTAPITKPSMAEFKPDMREVMFNYCSTLTRNNAPFSIDLFPLKDVQDNFNNDIEFAFFENNSTSKFSDGDFFYNNIFEVMFDSYVHATEILGFTNMTFIVGSIGWPTDGSPEANLQNAESFIQGLAKFTKSEKGTPLYPRNIDIYIHNIADENAIKATGTPYMRHWGIYRFDGQPKFNLDFTGNGRKVNPVAAVGITHMPKRWCVLDTSKIDPQNIPFETLDAYFNTTCMAADCTSMAPGASCSSLSFPLNYSYAFNAGFQSSKQSIQPNNSCNYGGYGIIVADNPSTLGCQFPIEIIAAETTNFLGQDQTSSSAFKTSSVFSNFVIVQCMFVILLHDIVFWSL